MNNVNKTLYIPLYGKAYVSRQGRILHDPMAEAIWAAEGFELKGKSRSKWLAYHMAMRATVFDRWTREQMMVCPEAVVLHLGCGMDSRAERVGVGCGQWYDVDFPEVIAERKRYFRDTDTYKMLAANVTSEGWLEALPRGNAIVIMEGISMYLPPDALQALLGRLSAHFAQVSILMDCYSEFAARASRMKNPINDVGVTQVYGLDDPRTLEIADLGFVREHKMTPEELIGELKPVEQVVFRKLYAGKMARSLYRLYEFRKQ